MLLRTDMGSTTCKDEQMIAIMGMKMPENCASCPCLYTDFEGWHCGTPVGKDKKICQDSLYFPQRPKWCPLIEVNND